MTFSASTKRRIGVFTSTRADYGLLQGVIQGIHRHPQLELALIVSGTHLSAEFGSTVSAIEADGYPVAARCEITMSGDSPDAVCSSLGLGLIKFAAVFDRLDMSLIVILGDRYEALAAATCALIYNVPVAHIHGGEATEGLIDEAIRHAITKMASLHFTAAKAYTQRVLQLGERPERVFTVGAMAADNLHRLELLSRVQLETSLGFALGEPLFAVTYHPVTLASAGSADSFHQLIEALRRFEKATVVLTKSNADTDGRIIGRMMDAFEAEDPKRIHLLASLGQARYLSLVREADVVIGNSSSGIIEAPLLGTPSVNVGDRQKGRLRLASIIDAPESESAIIDAIECALRMDRAPMAADAASVYACGGGAAAIVDVLEHVAIESLRYKTFHELPIGPAVEVTHRD